VRCAVLGDPIAHSLSPVLHRAVYAARGIDGTYEAVQVPAGGLGAFLAGLDGGWRGLSLTMPLKREVLALGTSRTAAVDLAGAANTVLLDGAGGVALDNTDLPGAAAAVRERFDGPVDAVTILGAGATAASVGLALCDLGAREVRLLARSPERAAATVAALARHPAAPAVTVGDLGTGDVTADLLVSTVPAAAQDAGLVARCAGVPVVFEVLYDPWPTPLAAAAAGRTLVSGLDLLVHQAALQHALFTGEPAAPADPGVVAIMREAGERALRERG
jgi:shikimate dehydrogenase